MGNKRLGRFERVNIQDLVVEDIASEICGEGFNARGIKILSEKYCVDYCVARLSTLFPDLDICGSESGNGFPRYDIDEYAQPHEAKIQESP